MNIMKHLFKTVILIAAAALMTTNTFAQNKKAANLQEVTFVTSMDCEKCVKKIEANISFEKGVKDLKTNLDDRTVYIKFDANKTDTEKLKKAIEKLGYTAQEQSQEDGQSNQ